MFAPAPRINFLITRPEARHTPFTLINWAAMARRGQMNRYGRLNPLKQGGALRHLSSVSNITVDRVRWPSLLHEAHRERLPQSGKKTVPATFTLRMLPHIARFPPHNGTASVTSARLGMRIWTGPYELLTMCIDASFHLTM